jgi:iron complex transport system permease protein
VPHAFRLWFGAGHKRLLPCAAVGGAVFTLLADLVARVVIAPRELPIGVVTAVVGAPLFLASLTRQTRKRQLA